MHLDFERCYDIRFACIALRYLLRLYGAMRLSVSSLFCISVYASLSLHVSSSINSSTQNSLKLYVPSITDQLIRVGLVSFFFSFF